VSRADRLTGILLALQGGRQTAAQLAERFGVSRRTILRDIDALGGIGVPVTATPGAGGGYGLAEGYWLPPLHFTAAEAAVLLLALRSLGDAATSPFGDAYAGADEKLRAALRPRLLADAERELAALDVVPPARPPDRDRFRLLRDAVRRERWLRVEYGSLRRVASHTLLPLRLSHRDGRWYLAAVSLEAGEERSYRLDRVRAIEPVATPPAAGVARSAAAGPRRPYDDPSHPEVVVRLSYRGLRLAEDAFPGIDRAAQLGSDEWEIRFRCPPSELSYYAREVHALGPTAEALAPPELRTRIRELAAATADLYADIPPRER